MVIGKGAKLRNINIDLVKSLAVCCVIWVHFFLNTGFYDASLHGWSGFSAVILRTTFMVCVPLFLIATGFLMKNKTLSKSYYVGVIRTISIYLVISLVCIAYRLFYLQQDYSVMDCVLSILNFSGCGYAWYVEMYIVLFLMIPFLNLAYQGLENQSNRKRLLATLIFIVALPPVINWQWNILPDWWNSDVLFPIMYYYLGAYLRDYPFSLKRSSLQFLLFAGWIILCGSFNYYMCINSEGNLFDWPKYTVWGSLQNVISAVLLFSWVQSVKLPDSTSIVGKAIIRVSKYSLGMYLSSWMVDSFIYSHLSAYFNSFNAFFPEMFWITIVILFIAFVISGICTEIAERIVFPIEGRIKERLSNA